MTKRNPVSAQQNIWFDAQQVDNTDLTLEQNHEDAISSAIINNHIGTGVVPEILVQNVLFDSSVVSGFLDGVSIAPQNQPADNNFGNQLEISLIGSKATIRKAIKVCVIGLDFQSNLQYESFYFKSNEIQISKKHFTKILVLFFNDFVGDPNLSFNLGGKIIISEARPMSLSRDAIMVSQDIEPNLFFRDFIPGTANSVSLMLQQALPLYNIDALNIFIGPKDNKILSAGDVVTQVGQKFLATTNNIQKITLLLSVQNQQLGQETNLVWSGDLVVSVYPLQSNIDCPTDIAPNLQIDFSPSNIPVAQLSINYNSLLGQGIVLDSVPQPIDFILSDSSAALGNSIAVGSYYALAVKRSGSANTCDILIAVGNDRIPDARVTTFNGTLWIDIPEEDLWFKIWTDSAKMSDGQAYESGHGIIIPKTAQDPDTLVDVDYCLDNIQFTGTDVFKAVVSASIEESDPIPDQRTGDPVLSRKQFVPQVSLLSTIDVINLENSTEPFIVGAISDQNKKSLDTATKLISANLYGATMINDELLIRVVDDPTDPKRYDASVNSLVNNLLLGYFTNAKINPNASNPSVYYRVADAKLASMVVGDVNGDGIIDIEDLKQLNSYIGFNFNMGLPQDSTVITDGIHTTFTNGYTCLSKPFTDLVNVPFQIIDPAQNNLVIANGTDGILIANPLDNRLAQFTSSSVNFTALTGIGSFKVVLLDSVTLPSYGGFDITELDTFTDVISIRKIYLDGNAMGAILRSDIDGDFAVTANDGYFLQNYIDRFPVSQSPLLTFPAPPTNPYTKIGTRFNVIQLRLEKFNDRTDDYSSVTIGRPAAVHAVPDIFLNDGYFASHNFYLSPVPILFERQLTWDDSLVVTNSRSKLLPSVFPTLNGFKSPKCDLEGILYNVYPAKPDFDSGRVDFFVPDNLIIGEGGELQRPDGVFYKVDFEVGTIVLEIPDGLFGSERVIDIINDFIASTLIDGVETGVTNLGFPAMKFADCTYVSSDALSKDQLRFSVSVQSFSPNTSGLSTDGYAGAIVDGKIGVSIDYATGLLTLNFTNLFQDVHLKTLSTKIQINVFLKKGGFNNQPVFIDSNKVQNMLNLISVFSGAVVGGPSALVDLDLDVTGVLPIIHGGTGLNAVGAVGTVLTSNGTGLSYQFFYDLIGAVPFSSGAGDVNRLPKLDGYGLLDPSFNYKNPVYIYGSAGIFTNTNNSPTVIGAFPFRFDKYILQGLQDIKLEVILETTNASNAARIQLYNVNTNSYLNLSAGPSTILSTTSLSADFLSSIDIKTQMSAGATNFVYEVHLSLTNNTADSATCKFARLVMTYDNPSGTPPTAHSSNFVPYLPSPIPV
jgi:hypothetical protein